MGLLNSLNKRVLALIDKRAATNRLLRAEVEDGSLLLSYAGVSQRRIAWSSLSRIVAIRRDAYAGDETSVLLEFAGSGVIEVVSSCQGWPELCAAIEKSDGVKPAWRLAL